MLNLGKLMREGTEIYRRSCGQTNFMAKPNWPNEIGQTKFYFDSGNVVVAAEYLLANCTHSSSTHKGSPAVSCSAVPVLCSSLCLARPKMYDGPQPEVAVCGADPM